MIRTIILYLSLSFFSYASATDSIFFGITIRDYDNLVPFFLKSIENLDYPKDLIQIEFNLCNTTQDVEKDLNEWIKKNQNFYKNISFINSTPLFNNKKTTSEKNAIFEKLMNDQLIKSKNLKFDYCFILSSEIFLRSHTLKHLIEKKLPVIAPMLRPIPEPGDMHRNFFTNITKEYLDIAYRQNLGTFKIPSINGAILIQLKYSDEGNIPVYICNEKEFGSFLHFKNEQSIEEQKKFSLIGINYEINSSVLHSILSSYYTEDPYLKNYADNFNFNDYAIYRVENRDLFYLDEVNDYIKSFVIKQGLNWEEFIQKQFEKYTKKGTIALDIGGHIGIHTLKFSKLVGEDGFVHVFEPQAKLFCELAINMHLNNCKNVQLHHRALGSQEKWIEMSTPPEEWTKAFASTLINEGHGTVSETLSDFNKDKAKVIRLDDLHLENISFIKIDVEGYELEVIQGGIQTILKNKPAMIIEIFEDTQKIEKIKKIESLGYKSSELGVDNYLFIPALQTPTDSRNGP